MARKRLGEMLIEAGLIDHSKLRWALSEQKQRGGHLGRILIEDGGVSEEALVAALSAQMKFPIVDLDKVSAAAAALDLLAGELADKLSVVPFAIEGKFLDLAMVDPTNTDAINTVTVKTKLNVRPHLCGPHRLGRALARYYNRGLETLVLGNAGVRSIAFPTDDGIGLDLGNSGRVDSAPAGQAAAGGSSDATRLRELETKLAELAAVERRLRPLEAKISALEDRLSRSEEVLKKLANLIIQKGVASRDEVVEYMKR